nr:MAG TPA: hypothetical protein [Caudoviricetes sp.]
MNGELENRVDEILLSIDGEFTIVDLVKILSSDELAIVFDRIDFLRNINVIGTRQTEKSLVYFVVQ